MAFLAAAAVVFLLVRQVVVIADTNAIPPRWQEGDWSAALGWTHIASDIVICVSFTTIAVMIGYLVVSRSETEFPKVYWLFAAFILACGVAHAIEAAAFWWPLHRLSALAKVATAITSLAAALVLIPIFPRLLSMPSRAADIETLFGYTPTAMLVIDHAGQILMANHQAESKFGYVHGELNGQNVEQLIPNLFLDGRPRFSDYFNRPGVTQLGEGRELYLRHKQGHLIPVEIGHTPLTIRGDPALLVCVVDQSPQKQQREQELAELGQAISLREVVGGLAHELNTPIQRIMTWAGIHHLESGQGRPDESVERITAAAIEAGKIVHRLRDAIVRKEMIDRPIELNTLVRETVAIMHREVTGVRLNLRDPLPKWNGDPVQIQLVLSNLIRNAYQAGGPVTVSTQTHEGGVSCVVEDCGPGFTCAPGELFDSFYSTKEGGLGMGLTITRAIVLRHGGRITAENTDRGARFTVTLPSG